MDVMISGSPFYNEKGQVICALSIITDITLYKKHRQELMIAMIQGEEKERARLAREMHDGIGQYLAAIKMNLTALNGSVEKEKLIIYDTLLELSKDAISEARTMSHNLLPKEIDFGLIVALNNMKSKYENLGSFDIDLNVQGQNYKLNEFIRFNLYRVIQEFINNTIKYADASIVTIDLIYEPDKFIIKINDNGEGFEFDETKSDGIGMKNMRQRTEILNGVFEFDPIIGKGTFLKVSIPMNENNLSQRKGFTFLE